MRQCLRRNILLITAQRRGSTCVSFKSSYLRFYSGQASSSQAAPTSTTTITVNSISDGELLGTVDSYERHYIISTTVPPEQWPKDVTVRSSEANADDEAEPAPATFIQAFKQHLEQTNTSTKINRVSSYYDASATTGTDVIVFPEKLKFSNMQLANISELVQAIKFAPPAETSEEPSDLDKETPATPETTLKHKSQDPITILICSHLNRDKSCGLKGPEIYQAAKSWIEDNKIDATSVNLLKSSHLGGHKHSGVCVVYPFGDWFGKVDKHSISNIMEVYLKNKLSSTGEPNLGASKEVLKMWRGRMGLTKQEQAALLKQFETPMYVADLSVF